jgi:hypothetical protein
MRMTQVGLKVDEENKKRRKESGKRDKNTLKGNWITRGNGSGTEWVGNGNEATKEIRRKILY